MLITVLSTICFIVLSGCFLFPCVAFRWNYIKECKDADKKKSDIKEDEENNSVEDHSDEESDFDTENESDTDSDTADVFQQDTDNKETHNEEQEENSKTESTESSKDESDDSDKSELNISNAKPKAKKKFFKIPIKECIANSKKFTVATSVFFAVISILLGIFGVDNMSSFVSVIQSLILLEAIYIMAAVDIKVKKIPNKLVLFALIIRIVGMFVELLMKPGNWRKIVVASLVGFLIGGLVILICMLISRGGIGAGDLKLFAVIGLYYSLTGVIEIMMYSLFLASIVSIVLLISKKAKIKSSVPMAPFICAGVAIYMFFLYA